MLNHALKQRNHRAGSMGTHGIFGIGEIFFQYVPFIVGYLADITRLNAHAVIGKNRIGCRLLVQCQIGGSQGHRQIRWNRRGNAKTPGIVNDRIHTHFLGQLQSWNVARIGQRVPQSDVALKFVIEIMRSIRNASAEERCRGIQNQVVRLGALVDCGGINKRFERRSHLALCLNCAIEL